MKKNIDQYMCAKCTFLEFGSSLAALKEKPSPENSCFCKSIVSLKPNHTFPTPPDPADPPDLAEMVPEPAL